MSPLKPIFTLIMLYFLAWMPGPPTAQHAHVHGAAQLYIVQEGQTLKLKFESPAANLVGFEYIATTEEEKQLVKEAFAKLDGPQKIWDFSGHPCELISHAVDMSGVTLQREGHDHHDDQHKKGHLDITATYNYHCSKVKNISIIKTNLFEAFPNLERIKVVWVTEEKQGSTTLKAPSKVIQID